MPDEPRQGIAHATLVAADAAAASAAYAAQLPLRIVECSTLAPDAAARLGHPELAGTGLIWLANHAGARVLRVLQDPGAHAAADGLDLRRGWMVVEFAVGELDELVAGLRSPFRVLGEPADLDFSSDLRAAQILGPAGEVLYLTRIRAPVPPFDLPQVTAARMRPFIGVVASRAREASVRAWAALLGSPGWQLETRISLINRAFGLPPETRHPIALLPMPGQSLVEIDALPVPPRACGTGRRGWLSLGLRLAAPDEPALRAAGWACRRHGGVLALRGPDGEHLELYPERPATG